jgi:hypothetical protein
MLMRNFLMLGVPAVVLLSTAVCLSEPPTPNPCGSDRVAQEIAALIRQLGDPSFPVRQAATERLLDLPEAAPALRQAL